MTKFIGLLAFGLVTAQLPNHAFASSKLDEDGVAETQAPIASLAELPLAEATAARCAVIFASVRQWQDAGDARGLDWPDMNDADAREFFVQAMAQIMEKYALDRTTLSQLVQKEFQSHLADEGAEIEAMKSGCLLALDASRR